MIISQGDQYGIPVAINIDGKPTDFNLFSNVEIVIGNIRKDISNGVAYSEAENAWVFPITQEESIKLVAKPQDAQVRVKFKSGDVQRVSLGVIDVEESMSKVVL